MASFARTARGVVLAAGISGCSPADSPAPRIIIEIGAVIDTALVLGFGTELVDALARTGAVSVRPIDLAAGAGYAPVAERLSLAQSPDGRPERVIVTATPSVGPPAMDTIAVDADALRDLARRVLKRIEDTITADGANDRPPSTAPLTTDYLRVLGRLVQSRELGDYASVGAAIDAAPRPEDPRWTRARLVARMGETAEPDSGDVARFVASEPDRIMVSLAARIPGVAPKLGEVLRPLRARFPTDARIVVASGLTHRARGEWPDALAAFEAVVEQHPDWMDAAMWSGETAAAMREYEIADRRLTAVREANGPDAERAERLHDWLRFHRDTDAGGVREGAVSASESGADIAWWRDLIDARYADLALRTPIAPRWPSPLRPRWFVYYIAGDAQLTREAADSARRMYETYLESESDDPVLRANLAEINAVLGQLEIALTDAAEAVRLRPRDRYPIEGGHAQWALARTYLLLGQHDVAFGELERLVSAPWPIDLPPLRRDPTWDPLRRFARFDLLVR